MSTIDPSVIEDDYPPIPPAAHDAIVLAFARLISRRARG